MKTNIDKRKVTMELLKYEKYKTLEDLPVVTKVYLPPVTAVRKGVIQIVHGMCETKERYDHFINFFNEKGYICVICDLRGHGENVEFEKDLGYIGDDGASLMVEDIHTITIFIKNNYPDLPITLLGHSMGSLIARAFTKKYDEDIDMLILCGHPSARKLRHVGVGITNFWSIIKDEHETDKFIDMLVIGSYKKRFAREGIENSWICSDMEVVEEYNNTPKCGFMFTINGHKTLCELQTMAYARSGWAVNNKKLRILFLAGEDDPCIASKKAFGRSVELMKKVGYKNVRAKLYKGMRHEIFNEKEHKTVFEDILRGLPDA